MRRLMVSLFLHLLRVLLLHPAHPLPQRPCLRRALFGIWSLGLVICLPMVNPSQRLLVQGLVRYHAATVGRPAALIIGRYQVDKGGSDL